MKNKVISISIITAISMTAIITTGFSYNNSPIKQVLSTTETAISQAAPILEDKLQTSLAKIDQQSQFEEMRGVWIASVLNIDFPKVLSNEVVQKEEIINILDNTQQAGLNAVFFQVRPQGDALYPSEIFPWSEYLTGTAGKNPGYDPLAYIIEEANKRGIEVHAWINPYRLSMGSTASPKTDLAMLPEGNPVKYRPELTMACQDGKLYLNPGEPEARAIVIAGVKEIIENYNVDGIHFDDYFYPSNPGFDDSAAFAKYGADMQLADWRRNNTYTLVKEIHDTIKTIKPSVEFGISPSGIWQNKSSSYLGSDTKGFESYSRIYADTRKWVMDGIIDYIAPQIYWTIGQSGSDYEILCKWWHNVCWETNVKLYIGHAAYKVGTNTPITWQDPEEISRQIALNRKQGNVAGSIFYGYSKIASNTLNLKDNLSQLFFNQAMAKDLIISYPASGQTTYAENMYLIGSADPRFPIYLEGQEVERTLSGHFAVYLPLSPGENTFTFTYKDQAAYFTATRLVAAPVIGGAINQPVVAPKVTILNPQPKAVIKNNNTTVRAKATYYSDRLHPLTKGVTDYAIAESNGYYQLAFGGWTLKNDVELSQESISQRVISQANIQTDPKKTILNWQMPNFAPYDIKESQEKVVITFYDTQGWAMNGLTEHNPIFKYVDYAQEGKDAVYTCQLKYANKMFGYQIGYEDGMLKISFNNPPKLAEGYLSLSDKTILLDAGHGGGDRGAAGPLGELGGNEKDLNLAVTLQVSKLLKQLGANVVLAREADNSVALEARAELIRQLKPDLAISFHRNSMSIDKEITNYQGALTLYSQDLALPFAQVMHQEIVKGTNLADGGMRKQSLAVCRIQECPAILLELGFITNPYEYEGIAKKSAIEKEAKAIVNGISRFLSNQW